MKFFHWVVHQTLFTTYKIKSNQATQDHLQQALKFSSLTGISSASQPACVKT